MEFEQLKSEYDRNLPAASKFCEAVTEQIQELLDQNSVAIGVPMEHRIKSWSSIYEKLEQKSLTLKSILELDDLIGIRIILLFKPDLEKVDSVLSESFVVEKVEDTGARLTHSEFGYQSKHSRNEYIDIGLDKVDVTDELNVESLKSTLSEKLPEENADIDEDFSELLSELGLPQVSRTDD